MELCDMHARERIGGTKPRIVGAMKRITLFLATSFTVVGMCMQKMSRNYQEMF
jgi:preprotein translocase subunit SecG